MENAVFGGLRVLPQPRIRGPPLPESSPDMPRPLGRTWGLQPHLVADMSDVGLLRLNPLNNPECLLQV